MPSFPYIWPLRLSCFSHIGIVDVGSSVPPSHQAFGSFCTKNEYLVPFRPGQHQCHGHDVGQVNPSPPTCMRHPSAPHPHPTRLTQPNEQPDSPDGQSACLAAVQPILSLPSGFGEVVPAPRRRLRPAFGFNLGSAHLPVENECPFKGQNTNNWMYECPSIESSTPARTNQCLSVADSSSSTCPVSQVSTDQTSTVAGTADWPVKTKKQE